MSKAKDEQIDMLLTFMKDDIESLGRTPQVVRFDFKHNGEDFLKFKNISELPDEEIIATLKICHSRGYIKHPYIGPDEIIALTTEGHERAISVEAAKNYKPNPSGQSVNTGNITVHGPAQIGNNNTQNIEGVFEYLIDKIEKSDATNEEKEEAKGLLHKALTHPIISSAIGSSIGAIITMLGV
jgi:hypothetical protein